MGAVVLTHQGSLTNIKRGLIIRYLGMKDTDVNDNIIEVIEKCLIVMKWSFKPQACYLEVPLKITEGNNIDLNSFKVQSNNLAMTLRGCSKAILCAATVGMDVDMVIKRSEVTSKAEALVYNAIGIAAIEQYMSELNKFFAQQYGQYSLRPRFSPGYGDLPLEIQRNIIAVLDTKRKIGVALSEKLLMTPSKSVTAIIGLGNSGCTQLDKDCAVCNAKDCEYRLS